MLKKKAAAGPGSVPDAAVPSRCRSRDSAMAVEIKKVPGGYDVEGILLRNGKCGCTSFAACCHTWSKVKVRDGDIEFTAKAQTPDTSETFEWGYTARKNGTTLRVHVQDARDKEIYSGFFPPHYSGWVVRGWEVTEITGEREDGALYRCGMSKWLYKEREESVLFEDLPDAWVCPRCGAPKSGFENIG